MADQAHKEPTMEEILSSIRKIISEDDTAPSAPEPEPLAPVEVAVDEPVNDDYDDLTLETVSQESTLKEALEEDIFETDDTFEADESFDEDTFQIEESVAELEDSFEIEIEDPVVEPEIEPELASMTEPEPAFAAAPEPQPTLEEKEPEMVAAVKLDSAALTDEATAGAAAGALGKLISNMDLGGENTIEALVRELLKPMIKEWLDANLQGIVESKVEAEVARIARMAR